MVDPLVRGGGQSCGGRCCREGLYGEVGKYGWSGRAGQADPDCRHGRGAGGGLGGLSLEGGMGGFELGFHFVNLLVEVTSEVIHV